MRLEEYLPREITPEQIQMLEDIEAKNVLLSIETDDSIICDILELKLFITKWLKKEGWEFQNFSEFLQLIGIETPIEVIEYDKIKSQFNCITKSGREIQINLLIGSWVEFSSEICVTEGNETMHYITNANIGIERPKVKFERTNINYPNKKLECCYSRYYCSRKLKFDNTHMLKVEIKICEPSTKQEKTEIFILRNSEKIEEYLLNLDKNLSVKEVYKNLLKYFEFSEEEISKCEKILISFEENVNNVENTLEKIQIKSGNIEKYEISENDESFYIFRDGRWTYCSKKGIRINYFGERKMYNIFFEGNEEEMSNFNCRDTVIYAKNKITKLFDTLN